jgi:hypothetical protein
MLFANLFSLSWKSEVESLKFKVEVGLLTND